MKEWFQPWILALLGLLFWLVAALVLIIFADFSRFFGFLLLGLLALIVAQAWSEVRKDKGN